MLTSFLLLLILGCAETDSFNTSKTEVSLRLIGHRLLLAAGDTSSRVPPLKKVSRDIYELRFDNQISINPDTLVALSESQHELERPFVVKVKSCLAEDIVYAIAIDESGQKSIIPCKGRLLPKDCYFVEFEFQPKEKASWIGNFYFILGLLGFPIFLFLICLLRRKNKTSETHIRIGNFLFDQKNDRLILARQYIELTNKEAQILSIFAEAPNQIIDRNIIQKAVWEDEGVIVGRSLDVYISKLRKKLSPDTSISLTNVHGKGYKLLVK